MKNPLLNIDNLKVSVDNNEILKGVSLQLESGKIYALMGPNGSGKSSLSYTVAGHPKYKVDQGNIFFEGEDITQLPPDLRAQKGIFLSFQYPKSIPGVTVANFLRAAYQAVKKEDVRVYDFQKRLKQKMDQLHIPHSFMNRFVNEGFSGGEKKKAEMLQALVLEPKLIIMDETDSGLDVDALKTVAEGIQTLAGPKTTIVLITHYFKILEYLTPDEVHVLKSGQIVESGGVELANSIEAIGFDSFKNADETAAASNEDPFLVLD